MPSVLTPSKAWAHQLQGWFQAYSAEEPVAGTFRARQLQAVLRLTPLTMAANTLNVLLVAWAFWGAGHRLFLGLWGACVALVVQRGVRIWQRWRRRGEWHSASPRALRRATLNAAALALLWGAAPLVLFPGAPGPQQLLVATVTTGMMCAGGFALATTPVAGTVYVLILGAAAGLSLVLDAYPLMLPVGGLLLVYCLIVLASVWSTARLFGARLMAEAEAERQNEVIGLLLRDFEENASDVLWETDLRGHLCHVSAKLTRLFGMSAQQLCSRPAVAWLREHGAEDPDNGSTLTHLQAHVDAGRPFRDLTVATTVRGRTRWWSLTAKPLVDAKGRRTGWRGVATDITDAHHANRRLTWLAHFDPLTGLTNRHAFRGELAALLARPAGAREGALLCLDLDHFKTINDTLGHGVGDALLQAVAHRLQQRTRRADTVARLGGDEFAVILRGVSSVEEVAQLTQRLVEGLHDPCEVQGSRVTVRASIGIAMADTDGPDLDTLLNHADLALYAAKTAGRGEFRFFAPQMAALTRRRLLLEQALRDALVRGELSLHYQPVVQLAEARVIGFEALLRWQHPELGEVPPGEFVPVAEEAGMIQDIGRWALGEACREAARWPEGLTVSVNVSPVQAMSADLCAAATQALADSGLAAGRLELEITESIFLHETQATMQVLHTLHRAGMRIALDDFGTGYSSLAYLRRFPFDTLKIDRSFVRELAGRRDARAIVRMIVGLARTLHMSVVAEGVENEAQAALLRRYGCDALQGFLAAPPMPADAVPGFLAAWA
ncbi:MAG: EAL domain-containing protein, partial [Rubrivivax sp.]|nr:EAL domain-containing protein [Rubrivivax sp.]